MLDRGERGRLEEVDHDRGREHRDAPAADVRGGVFGGDGEPGTSLESRDERCMFVHRVMVPREGRGPRPDYYSMVAATLNAHELLPPPEVPPPLSPRG
jgi:hypothetical protein